MYKILFLDTDFTINNDSRNPDSKVQITNKTEEVYCVSVSTGLILVRGNNKVTSVCGNCAMLEHGTVYLAIPMTTYAPDAVNFYYDNPYSKVNECNDFIFKDKYGNEVAAWCVTTNFRVLVENNLLDDLEFLCEPTEYHEKRVTVRFITDQGILREFSRHRAFSFGVESTRYCNYSKDKFNNELTFIIPPWIDKNDLDLRNRMCEDDWGKLFSEYYYDLTDKGKEEMHFSKYPRDVQNFLWGLFVNEQLYLSLLKQGWKPQQVRNILPLATKCEIVMTAFISD